MPEHDIHNLPLNDRYTKGAADDESEPTAEEEAEDTSSVGTLSQDTADDRKDPQREPAALTAEEWAAAGFYAAEIHITDNLEAPTEAEGYISIGYDEYRAARTAYHEDGYFIRSEAFQTPADYFPGLLTFEDVVNEFKTADDRKLEIKAFPEFSKTAKIGLHSSVVIAADTGAGKSSLAINFMHDLNDRYPVLYINLEMDRLTVLRRLVSIHTGLELDAVEGYQQDERTAEAVNSAVKALTARKPLQIIDDAYSLKAIEKNIAHATDGRKDPTIVIIDHALLIKTAKAASRLDRFTEVSEKLRGMARKYNIIMFVLLQQNRAGKSTGEPPTNSSLKETGSWENDATLISFLWYDPEARKKKLIITKNRGGDLGEFILNYWPRTQYYTEAKDQPGTATTPRKSASKAPKKGKREQARERLQEAYNAAVIRTGGTVTLLDLAEEMDCTTRAVKGYLKEYGNFILDGQELATAGIDNIVEDTGIIRLTPGEKKAADEIFGTKPPHIG